MEYTSCGAATLIGIDARCDNSFGGIKRILVGNRDEWTIDVNQPSGTTIPTDMITSITYNTPEPRYFVEFKFKRNTGNYTSTVAPDVTIGNNAATTEVNLQFTKAETNKRMAIQSLINSGNSCIIIEDMYGQYIYLGVDNGVYITNAVMQSGTAESDLNGFTLTLQDVSQELPYFIDTTQVEIDQLIEP